MSWSAILYTLAALFVLLFGLPRALWHLARMVHRYTHPIPEASKPSDAKRQSSKLRVPEMS